ncbi:acyltransferase family protein [Silvibacterium acidisoli]|uniref:acyltransferase family protein n=1 Tax=Acidobacteriaceae bacterium ZG23-2 TaxID=2883246 RepID=UPI00406C4914
MATTVEKPAVKQGRIVSLDVMRGIVISFMILVNNGTAHSYWPLEHAAWNGWTPTDMVFPSFLLMVGVTSVFSTESRLSRGEDRMKIFLHTLKRALILFLFGLIVNSFPFTHFHFATMRIPGVLQRIALCYLIVCTLYLLSRRALTFVVTAVVCLVSYYILMRFVPVPGFGVPTHDIPLLDPDRNLVAYWDRTLLPGRLYEGTRDPEGMISTIPSIATACIGALAGLWLRTGRPASQKLLGLVAASITGLITGKIWNIWFPINKKLWTSSYVLFAAGITLMLMAICYYLVDIKQWRGKLAKPWLIFGSNAITAYIVSELLPGFLDLFHIQYNGKAMSPFSWSWTVFYSHIGSLAFGSLLYSLTIVAICFIPNLILYRKKIFLKV